MVPDERLRGLHLRREPRSVLRRRTLVEERDRHEVLATRSARDEPGQQLTRPRRERAHTGDDGFEERRSLRSGRLLRTEAVVLLRERAEFFAARVRGHPIGVGAREVRAVYRQGPVPLAQRDCNTVDPERNAADWIEYHLAADCHRRHSRVSDRPTARSSATLRQHA